MATERYGMKRIYKRKKKKKCVKLYRNVFAETLHLQRSYDDEITHDCLFVNFYYFFRDPQNVYRVVIIVRVLYDAPRLITKPSRGVHRAFATVPCSPVYNVLYARVTATRRVIKSPSAPRVRPKRVDLIRRPAVNR